MPVSAKNVKYPTENSHQAPLDWPVRKSLLPFWARPLRNNWAVIGSRVPNLVELVGAGRVHARRCRGLVSLQY